MFLRREALLAKIAAGESLAGTALRTDRPSARRSAAVTEEEAALVKQRFPDELVGRVVPFVISGPERLDDGYAIDPMGWDLTEYDRAPGVLWNHCSYSTESEVPARIADALAPTSKDALTALACFYPRDFSEALDDGFSWAIGELAALRGYRASVGFQIVEAKLADEETRKRIPWALDVSVARLREWSVLNLGMDDAAISAGRAAGVDTTPVARAAAKVLDAATLTGLVRSEVESVWRAAVGKPSKGAEALRAAVRDALGAQLPRT